MKKRLYFTFLLLLTNLMASAYDCQVDGIYYNLDTSGKTAEVTTSDSGYSGRVNIPSSVSYDGTSYSVTSIGEKAFSNCRGLTSVNIPSSVTSIGRSAFSDCWDLASVTIPSSVTSIGRSAFLDCRSLTSVTIPSSVTSIGEYAFRECYDLTSVTIPSSVTSIGEYAFSDCYDLTSVTIPSSVTSIGERAFSSCSGLTSVTIPSSVTSIGEKAFDQCSGLTSINVAEGNTTYDSRGGCNAIIETSSNTLIVGCQNTIIPSSVTSIGGSAFSYCVGPTSVTIPSSVTSIGEYAFSHCSGLTSVTIPSSVTSIGFSAFSGCSGLTSVTIPNSVTSIREYTFSGCSRLGSVTIPSSVTSIGYMAFDDCRCLTYVNIDITRPLSISERTFYKYRNATLYVPAGSKEAYEAADIWKEFGEINESTIYFADANVKALCVENWDTDGDGELSKDEAAAVTEFGEVFKGNEDITSFDELQYFTGLTSIGGSAFSDCRGLTSITIPSSVTSIGEGAFSYCRGLTSITIPSSVTSFGDRAFYDCWGLTSVNIPSSVTSIGEKAFSGCSGLTSINVAEGNTTYDSRGGCNAIIETSSNTLIVGCQNTIIPSSVTSIGGSAFSFCGGLTSVTIPSSVTSIGDRAFYFCGGLTSVTIPSSVTSIGRSAFSYCSGLTSVTIPSSVTSIGGNAFYACSGLTSVTIPSSVTSIGGSAFSHCSGLTSVNIPSSVTSIGEEAFYYCSGLTSVNIDRTQPLSISAGTFSNRTKATLYVPAGSKEAYEAADYWKDFKEIKESTIYFADANVKALCVENWDTDGDGELSKDEAAAVTELGEVFKGNEDITSFDELQYFTGLTSIGSSAFSGCINMTSVIIPSSVTSIGYMAFGECKKLSSMEIPDGVVSIGTDAYWVCLALTSIHIPRSVVSIAEWSALPTSVSSITVDADNPIYDSRNKCNAVIETATNKLVSGCKNTIIPKDVVIIGVTAFSSCYELTSIDIPNNITQIERDAFAWSYMLNSVTCHWQEPISFGEHAFDHIGGECTLTIPYGTKAAYIAKGWTEDVFKGGIIEAAPDPSPLNTLAITDVGVCKGKQITIPVNMNNTESITALQFDLTLPAGVSIAKNDQGKYIVEKTGRCADHTLNVSKPGDANVYRVLLYITSVENITGSEGAVLNVTLETSESMAEGEYDVTISKINLTTPDATKITPADVTCKLTVHNSIPGDANGDGSIDVTDIVSIANAILGRASSSFDAAAADVNGDGSIDVTDIVVIANMILRGNGQSNAKMRGGDEDDEEDMLDPQ